MKYSSRLVQRLKEEFPEREFQFSNPPGPAVTIPPDCAEVGAIEIYDEDDELTLYLGRFTHTHFSPYNYTGFSEDELVAELVEDTVQFLQDVFSDKVVFWGAHESSGGTYRIDRPPSKSPIKRWGPRYVWSGEYHGAQQCVEADIVPRAGPGGR